MKKIIGFDLDNTIVIYDNVFKDLGKIIDEIPDKKKLTKDILKQYFIKSKKEYIWTRIQCHVYGLLMHDAKLNNDFFDILKYYNKRDYNFCIISHRTKTADSGDPYNMQYIAKKWIDQNIKKFTAKNKIKIDVYFADSYINKIKLIKKIQPNYFIDDLQKVIKDLKNEDEIFGIHYMRNKKIKNHKSQINNLKQIKKII